MTASSAIDVAKRAASEGEMIVQKAHDDFGFAASGDSDGPMMQRWLKGERLTVEQPSAARLQITAEQIQMVDHVLDFVRAERWIAASMGLARLRESYDAVRRRDLPADEQSWEAFAAKHIPLPAGQVAELIGRMVHSGAIRCVKCCAGSTSACGCGVPYVGDHRWSMKAESVGPTPAETTALDRAIAAVRADPAKSNRVIASEIGVGYQTVRRARQQVQIAGDDGSPDGSPEETA